MKAFAWASRCIILCGTLLLTSPHAYAEETAAVTHPSQIPAEVFAALPDFSNARLSPDGERLAYLQDYEGRRSVMLVELKTGQKTLVPAPSKGGYYDLRWANERYLLLHLSFTANRSEFRNQTTETRIISLDAQTTDNVWLGKPDNRHSQTSPREFVSQHERIVDLLPDEAEYVLLELDTDLDGQSEVYKSSLKTGRRSAEKLGRSGVQDWYTDTKGEIRLGIGYYREKRVVRFKGPNGEWENLDKVDWADRYSVAGFTTDPEVIYVRGISSYGTESIYRLNVENGEIVDTVFEHETYDAGSIIDDPLTGKIIGVSYTDDFYRVKYFDDTYALVKRSIDAAMPDTVNTLLSYVPSKDWYMILVDASNHPGAYFIYDRPNRNMFILAQIRETIDSTLMSHTSRMDIPVRDGSAIPAYLTMPISAGENPGPLPTIILPHGGPTARDTTDWDYEAQFYASRGYLVLKPNFRGSTGFGVLFEDAGTKQWGGLMQDDVTDATKWLIAEGYADPERICIVGSSYGGYAALMGVIKEPGLYACAVSVNGVADLKKLKSGDKHYIGGRVWIEDMGLEGVDDEEVSPYQQAEKTSAPVLLIAAKDDARVPYRMSKAMHSMLKKMKKPSEYVELKEGTHYMITAEARLKSLQATEAFLAKYLAGTTLASTQTEQSR